MLICYLSWKNNKTKNNIYTKKKKEVAPRVITKLLALHDMAQEFEEKSET